MKDICIIPTHERPEFLWITLEKIAAATNRDNVEFWICEDTHYEKPEQLREEIFATIDYSRRLLGEDVKHFQTRHDNHGSSYNVLTSFERACETDASFVFFIEDDVRITEDFFRFCYMAQEGWSPFFVTGNCAPQTVSDPRADGIVGSNTWGQTFSMCFNREKLKQMLKPTYSDYGIQPTSEWDNYLLRYMQQTDQFCVCAALQRGYHFGFHSYHAGKSRLTGTLAERLAQTKAILTSPSTAGLDKHAAQVGQINIPFPSQPLRWEKLRKVAWTAVPRGIRIPIPFGIPKERT